MKKKIKILILTDSLVNTTGLAETARNIFYPLLDKYDSDYAIQQLGWHHNPNTPRNATRWPTTPTRMKKLDNGQVTFDMADKYGQLSFPEAVKSFRPDIVFGYGDLWCWEHVLRSPLRNQFKLIVYYTVDGQPYPGHWRVDGSTVWGDALSRADRIISLSEFGVNTLGCLPEVNNDKLSFMPNPADLSKYKPLTKEEKDTAKAAYLGVKYHGQPVIGWVGRTQFRKQNHVMWQTHHYLTHGDYIICEDCGRYTVKEWNHAARETMPSDRLTIYEPGYDYSECWYCKSKNIKEGRPRDVLLAMHTPRNEPSYNFELFNSIWSIDEFCTLTRPHEEGKALPHEEIAKLTGMFDIFYYPSGGEGWGNPPMESMLCEVPVVYSNYSSHADFCKYGGLPIRIGAYQPEQNFGINRAMVDTGDAVKQLCTLLDNPELRDELGRSGRKYLERWDKTKLVNKWDKIFKDLHQETKDTFYAVEL